MKTLGTLIYTIVTVGVLGVAALFLVSLVPIPGNVEVKIVKSGSMEPNIHTGSIVVIQPQEQYSIGEVITFGKDTKTDVPTTHRIAKVEQDAGGTVFVTKGDANEDPDPNPVREGEVIGKVVFSLPYAGYILNFAKQPLGFALLIVMPAAAIVLDELMAIWREIVKLRKKKRRASGEEDEDEAVDESDDERFVREVRERRLYEPRRLVPNRDPLSYRKVMEAENHGSRIVVHESRTLLKRMPDDIRVRA